MAHVSQATSVRITEAFIRRDPSVIIPQHRTLQTTENGGKRWVLGSAGPTETVRVTPNTTVTEKKNIRTTQDGRTVNPGWNVVCPADTAIEVGDLLPWGTNTLEVVYKMNRPSWRVVFEAIEYDG